MGNGRDRDGATTVRVVDRYSLVGVGEITHNALGEDVEGAAKEYLICGQSNDVNLHVKCEAGDGERDVASEAEGIVDGSVCREHV